MNPRPRSRRRFAATSAAAAAASLFAPRAWAEPEQAPLQLYCVFEPANYEFTEAFRRKIVPKDPWNWLGVMRTFESGGRGGYPPLASFVDKSGKGATYQLLHWIEYPDHFGPREYDAVPAKDGHFTIACRINVAVVAGFSPYKGLAPAKGVGQGKDWVWRTVWHYRFDPKATKVDLSATSETPPGWAEATVRATAAKRGAPLLIKGVPPVVHEWEIPALPHLKAHHPKESNFVFDGSSPTIGKIACKFSMGTPPRKDNRLEIRSVAAFIPDNQPRTETEGFIKKTVYTLNYIQRGSSIRFGWTFGLGAMKYLRSDQRLQDISRLSSGNLPGKIQVNLPPPL